jgi:hypothetical protein
VNLDLGSRLLKGLSTVDPLDMDVARFFVYALLGPDYDGSSWTKAGERVHHLAVAGIRLVVEELRTDVTRTRKDGTRGRLKIDYGDPKQPEDAINWLWKYLDRASTPGELYGRALVVVAAEQYAARMVLPGSQRTYRYGWGSHKDLAAKAMKKLAGPHLPASLKALERAVEGVHAEHRATLEQLAAARAAASRTTSARASRRTGSRRSTARRRTRGRRCGSRRAGPVLHAFRACGPRRDRPRTERGHDQKGRV